MAFGNLSGDEDAPQAEINMIPMIDVMLVLLIVFMITAPLLTNAVKLELPEASSPANAPRPQDITLSVTAAGGRYWNGAPVSAEALTLKMKEAALLRPLPELQLQVDKQVPYGEVASLMAEASRQGLSRIAFVSRPGEEP